MTRKTLSQTEMQNKRINHPRWQIFCVPEIADPMGNLRVLFQRRNIVKRIFKRRWNYVVNYFKKEMERIKGEDDKTMKNYKIGLNAGDIVRVKSKEEIQSTLDRWNQLKGCSLTPDVYGNDEISNPQYFTYSCKVLAK